MRFLFDHDVPDDLSFALEAMGHEVVKLREWLPVTTPDDEVLRLAAERECLLLTCNRDPAHLADWRRLATTLDRPAPEQARDAHSRIVLNAGGFHLRPHPRGNPGDVTGCDILAPPPPPPKPEIGFHAREDPSRIAPADPDQDRLALADGGEPRRPALCLEHGHDPSNWSKMVREVLPPPRHEEIHLRQPCNPS